MSSRDLQPHLDSRPPTAAQILADGRRLLPALAREAAVNERERRLPYEAIDRIAEKRLLALRVPSAYGGPGTTLVELFGFVIDLSTADSNVAQALRPAYLFVEHLRRATDEAERARWFPHVLAGEIFANAGWERGGPNGAISSRVTRREDGLIASGVKSYSTGALYADWVSTVAVDDDGQRVAFTIPVDRAGVVRRDDWDGFGQRLTASGTTELNEVVIDPSEIRRSSDASTGRSPTSAVAQLYLGAVLAGIARNALDDGAAFARDHARPIVHAGVARSIDDPYVQQAVGTMSARAFTAEAAVLRAAASLGAALESVKDDETLTNAALDVARAQYTAAGAALENGTALFEVGGASTTLRKHNLDRHWRNARTVANHNPRAHKAAVLGAWHLTGAEPPTSGLF